MRATPVKAVAGFAVALALLAACGDDGGGSDDTDSTDTTEEATDTSGNGEGSNEATTTEPLSPEDEVLAAYDKAVAAVEAAYKAADPDHPDLLATFAGRSLALHQTSLGDHRTTGNAEERLDRSSDAAVTRLVGDSATVEECWKETLQIVDLQTGEPTGPPREDSAKTEWSMERIDGTWKVVRGERLEPSCEPS